MEIECALDEYASQNDGHYPSSLQALLSPDKHGIRYLEGTRIPRDAWCRDYRYQPPTATRARARVFTFGRDGLPGGEDDIDDSDVLALLADCCPSRATFVPASTPSLPTP